MNALNECCAAQPLTRVPAPLASRARRDCAVLVVTALGIAIVLHPFQNTPFIDDWVYSWPVQHLLDTGTFLFPEGADLDAVNSGLQHAAPLHNAVSSGSLAAVKTLVEAGARLDTKDIGYRLAPLDWAEWYVREAARGRDAREYAEIAAYLRDRRERS